MLHAILVGKVSYAMYLCFVNVGCINERCVLTDKIEKIKNEKEFHIRNKNISFDNEKLRNNHYKSEFYVLPFMSDNTLSLKLISLIFCKTLYDEPYINRILTPSTNSLWPLTINERCVRLIYGLKIPTSEDTYKKQYEDITKVTTMVKSGKTDLFRCWDIIHSIEVRKIEATDNVGYFIPMALTQQGLKNKIDQEVVLINAAAFKVDMLQYSSAVCYSLDA